MKRSEKYPETKYFHYYNANPKNRMTGDCWLRAVCTGLNQDYNQTLREMVEVQLKTGYELSCDKAVEIYLESKGWKKCKQPRKFDNTKYTGKDFCEEIQRSYELKMKKYPDRIIANIGGHHMVAIVEGKVNDIWDSTNGCIGNYYVKE